MAPMKLELKDIQDVLTSEIVIASSTKEGKKLTFKPLNSSFRFYKDGVLVHEIDSISEGQGAAVDYWNNEF